MKVVEPTILYPKVLLYPKAFLLAAEYASYLNTDPDNEFKPWGRFGRVMNLTEGPHYTEMTMPFNKEHWEEIHDTIFSWVKPNMKDKAGVIGEYYYQFMQDYLLRTNTQWDYHAFAWPEFCQYESQDGDTTNTAMEFHADFPVANREGAGIQQMVTFLVYLNDNYGGGHIEFKILEEDGRIAKFIYKPQAGDILIFPSDVPYYHGVHPTVSGRKQFIRAFALRDYPGDKEWQEAKELGGEEFIKQHKETVKYRNEVLHIGDFNHDWEAKVYEWKS